MGRNQRIVLKKEKIGRCTFPDTPVAVNINRFDSILPLGLLKGMNGRKVVGAFGQGNETLDVNGDNFGALRYTTTWALPASV